MTTTALSNAPGQFEFDFETAERERGLTEHWARLERLAREKDEFGEENLCRAWVTQSDGFAHKEWWDALPCYERSRLLTAYRFEREIADYHERAMTPFQNCPESREVPKEVLQQERGIIEFFKREIQAAAVDGRPMPLREGPEMTPAECLHFRIRLSMAMTELGVVIVSAQPQIEPKSHRRV